MNKIAFDDLPHRMRQLQKVIVEAARGFGSIVEEHDLEPDLPR
jgi:hypothetical protein